MESVDTPEPVVKGVTTKSSMDKGKSQQQSSDDDLAESPDNHLPQSLQRCTAQIQSRFIEVLVQLAQLGPDRQDHIRDVKGYMGKQQVQIPKPHPGEHERES